MLFKINSVTKKADIAQIKADVSQIKADIENKLVWLSGVQTPLAELVDLLKIYTAFQSGKEINLIRLGGKNDGGYVLPEEAIKAADVLMGYGIAQDSQFEEGFSTIYNKHSYGFDCGVNFVKSKNPLFHFVNECIASDKCLYQYQTSSNKVSSFTNQLTALNLLDKKVFLKMDIEGAEYDAFDDIFKHSKNITGIVLEIHFCDYYNSLYKAINLLSNLNKDFVLVHVHGNNHAPRFMANNLKGMLTCAIELSYINKSLVTEYHIASNQSRP